MRRCFAYPLTTGSASSGCGIALLVWLLLGVSATATPAWAQNANNGGSPAQIQALDKAEAEQERMRKLIEGKPPAYEDKVMDASTLPAATSDENSSESAGTGVRSFSAEGRYGFAQSSTSGYPSRSAAEWGLRTDFRWETLNYGEWQLQADGRSRHGDATLSTGSLGYAFKSTSERVTLRNMGFPLTPSIFADTTAGDMYSDITDALRRSYRLSLGGSTVRGLSTRVYGRDFDVSVGTGDRGMLLGGPYAGFESTGGTVSWAGASRRFDKISTGIQVTRASGVPTYFWGTNLPNQVLKDDVTSVAAALGYGQELLNDGDKRARLTLIQSQTSANLVNRNNQSHGAFLETGFRLGSFRNELGVYTTQPNLRFGEGLLASDNRGAYWRIDRSNNRLSWGAGIDFEQYNPNHEAGRHSSRQLGLSGNVQYRYNRNNAFGASVNWMQQRYDYGAASAVPNNGLDSLYASGFYQTRFYDWGNSRLRVTARRNQTLVLNDVAATGQEIEWEQDWITAKYETMRPELTTTVGWARDQSTNVTQTHPTAGVVIRQWLDAGWSISGNLRYTSHNSHLSTSRGLSGSLNTETQLTGGWRIGAALQLNQAKVNNSVVAGMLPTTQISRSNDKAFFIYLRWDGSTGTSLQGAGQRHIGSAGGGGISGTVYFDANRDDEQQANENGVPNVEVFLDGRYRVVTDSAGRFEFPMVTTGSHRLTLRLESVPLPWGVANDQGQSVEVPLRGQANARIPVVRVGGE